MNIKKTLTQTAASLIGLAITSSAFAQAPIPTIYIAGANGDRATVNTAIQTILAEGAAAYKAGVNATATSSNYVIYEGTYNGQTVRVKASYIGATGGIYGVAGQQPIKFLPDTATTTSSADPTVNGNPNEPVIPHIAVSSSSQGNSPFVGEYQGITYENLIPTKVAVLPLTWVASPGFPAANITTQQAELLFKTGKAPLSLFTGQLADRNKTVFATGRNLDAGQRIVSQEEIGIGWSTYVKQYKPTSSGGTSGYDQTVGSHQLWPVDPNNYSGGSSEVAGNGGQDTGANLAKILSSTLSPNAYTEGGTTSATGGWYISYLTPNDAKGIINGANVYNNHRAVPLAYNGVTIWNGNLNDLSTGSFAFDSIKEGQYTFWTYEQIYLQANLASQPANGTRAAGSLAQAFASSLINTIKGFSDAQLTALGSVKYDSVLVERTSEGAVVGPQ